MKVTGPLSILVVIVVNVLLLLTGTGAAQALMLRLSLDDMAVGADTILVGTVVSKSSAWNAERTGIYTSVVISVEETLKGPPGQNTVTITVPGGTADGLTEWVEHAAVFQPGERSVLFLKRQPDTRFEVYGHYQGKLPVVGGKVSGMPLALFRERVSRAVKSTAALEKDTRQPVGPVFLDVTKLAPPQAVPQQSAVKSPGWQAILEDGFEGAFPGVWSVSGNATSGGHTWGKNTWNVYSGSYSAWCAGSTLNPVTSNYANNMDAWMVYGPFSLADAGTAELIYYRWRYSEANADYFYVMMSTDGQKFSGWRWSGQGDTWASVYFDLREDWPYIGNLVGRPQLWLAFNFDSNASGTQKGVFVDDVVLQKYVGVVPQITGITPPSASAGTNSTITITGTGFGSGPGALGGVDFYYQYGEPFIRGSIISWTNTSIVTTVPTGIIGGYPATAGSGPVGVGNSENAWSLGYPFTVTFSYGGVKWAGTGPVVNYRVNPNTADTTGEEVAVQNAANTWNAVPNKAFTFNYAGSTSETQSTLNSFNDMMWYNSGNNGVLAFARYWWNTSNNIVEADIQFNDYYTWSTAATTPAGQYDVQTIALHEMGHWLNLRDLYGDVEGFPQDSAEVMFGYGPSGETKRVLHADDMAGIQWIYPAAAQPPAVTTDGSTTNSTTNSATLNGTLTSLGSSGNVTVSFQWGLSENYTAETAAVSMNATGAFSSTLYSLSRITLYHYRAKAVGSGGTSYGVDRTFSIWIWPPAVTTNEASAIGQERATLNGTLDSMGTAASVQVSFQWGVSENYTYETTPATLTSNATAFSANITGLSPNTTYHLRAKAAATSGTSYGVHRTFTTLSAVLPPTVTTDNATGVTSNSAVLGGTLTSLGSSGNATLSFQYGTSTNYTGETTPLLVTTNGTAYSAAITGLSPNTTYHFRAKAVGAGGTGYGIDRTFTTRAMSVTRDLPAFMVRGETYQVTVNFTAPANLFNAIGLSDFAPVAWTLAANKIWGDPDADQSKITTNATAGINRVDYLWYGPDNPDGSVGYGQGTTFGAVYQVTVPAGATPGTYTFNGVLEYYVGSSGPFTENVTGDTAVPVLAGPSVTTDNATDVYGRGALLSGTLTSLGTSTNATVSFQWGTSTSYTGETPSITTNTTGPFGIYVSGLSESTTYHFRAKAVGVGGASYGADATFTTPVVNVLRDLPPFAAKGQTFQVSVNFTAPANLFNAIGISEFIPVSWNATVDKTWNTPAADQSKITGNRVDYVWYGPDNPDGSVGYGQGTLFTAIYRVTVPADAAPGLYRFTGGRLEYYTGTSGPFLAGVGGDFVIEVIEGARIEGVTRSANTDVLTDVTVTLDGAASVTSDASGIYRIVAGTIGTHTLVASKTGWRSQTQTLNVTDLTAAYTADFKGRYSLVPNAPNLSYVLACINKWKFPPADGSGPDLSKVLSVINAWKFPI